MKQIAALYRNAYSGLSPSTWWLSVVMLINRCGTMVVPFMTLYLTQSRNYSISQAGFVMGLFGAGAICGGLIGGKLTDKVGFYYIQLLALLGGGSMFLVLGQMESYTSVCITTFILSLVNESFRPANAAAIAHYSTEENRTRSYSLNRLAINLGWATGGALGGFIASKNYHLLFWIDGFTNIGAAIMLWLVLAPSKNKHTAQKNAKPETPSRPAYKDKAYLAFIGLTMIYAYCFFQLFLILPVYYRQDLHLPESYIGLVMAVNGVVIALFEMVIIHKLEGRRHNLQFITWGVLLTGSSFLVLNLLPGTYMVAMVSILVVTAGEIFSMPFMNSFWIGRTDAGNRGQYAGLYTVAWSAAQVLSPATGAQIAERMGFTTLWWFVGGICVLSALGYRWLYYRTNRERKA